MQKKKLIMLEITIYRLGSFSLRYEIFSPVFVIKGLPFILNGNPIISF